MAIGKVYLVGAGPGDPGLLTLRGQACLGMADVVLYDYLANPQILQHASPHAELVCLGRHGPHGRLLTQDEINAQMLAAASAGKKVVRLKGGDTAIFGRAAEEMAALDATGIPYEVVPGITAALAAGSYAGIPLTHRERASCVAFVTGQQCLDKDGQPLDYGQLANFPGTLVFYMGITTASDWAATLIEHGKPRSTPVAIVRQCSLPKQSVTRTTLGEISELVVRERLRPPAIVIVGDVATGDEMPGSVSKDQAQCNWFLSRPLFGRIVLVTRPAQQAAPMVERLLDLGAEVVCQPAIHIGPPDDWEPVDAAIGRLDAYDWLVFSSANGVRYFLDRLLSTGRDVRALGNARLAAIGPATVATLAEYHLHADLQPEEYRAEALAEALADVAVDNGVIGKKFLLLRASRGREYLAETLAAAGAASETTVEQVVVYESRDVAHAEEEIAETLAAGKIDWVTVTSSAIARSLVQLFGADLARTKLAAISPLTALELAGAGYPPTAIASQYTSDGLIDAILQAEAENSHK